MKAHHHLTPNEIRARAHPICNAGCHGDDHAIVLWCHDNGPRSAEEILQQAAVHIGGELVSWRPAPEAPAHPVKTFTATTGHVGPVANAKPYLGVFRWAVSR